MLNRKFMTIGYKKFFRYLINLAFNFHFGCRKPKGLISIALHSSWNAPYKIEP